MSKLLEYSADVNICNNEGLTAVSAINYHDVLNMNEEFGDSQFLSFCRLTHKKNLLCVQCHQESKDVIKIPKHMIVLFKASLNIFKASLCESVDNNAARFKTVFMEYVYHC